MNRQELIKEYRLRTGKYTAAATETEKQILIISILRLIVFAGGIVLTWIIALHNAIAGVITGVTLLTIFLLLLKRFLFLSRRKSFLTNLVLLNKDEAEAQKGNFQAFDDGSAYVDIHHDYSFDIDLFGPGSVFRFLNRTVTENGRDKLAGWLMDSYSVSDKMQERQKVIRELAAKQDWRHSFLASGMSESVTRNDLAGLISWINDDSTNEHSFIRKSLLYILPGAALVSLLIWITGIISYGPFLTVFLVNLGYISSGLKRTNSIHRVLSKKYEILRSVDELLFCFENESFESERLNEIKDSLTGDGESASMSVRKLGRLIQAFDSRNNMIAGVVLNGLLLWDYRVVNRLEIWKERYRSSFGNWIAMIAEIDAFISLANYSYNHQSFTFPVISSEGSVFSAAKLGHILIDEERRICNDFTTGAKGSVCIITGANMAGKSTFLRTVAVNYILAMAGAPVCAESFCFIPMKIFTSMRTSDSLSDNESYFYAELRRLGRLKSAVNNNEPVFFVLDEILKGTNSEDKSMGSKLFLTRIVEKGGTGMIATHDISLGAIEKEYPGVTNKCFEIDIEGDTVRFDYLLKEGITKKMNAVFLMNQMGILD